MAPKTDRTTRIPSGVAPPVTTNHAAKGSVSVNLRNTGNFEMDLGGCADVVGGDLVGALVLITCMVWGVHNLQGVGCLGDVTPMQNSKKSFDDEEGVGIPGRRGGGLWAFEHNHLGVGPSKTIITVRRMTLKGGRVLDLRRQSSPTPPRATPPPPARGNTLEAEGTP